MLKDLGIRYKVVEVSLEDAVNGSLHYPLEKKAKEETGFKSIDVFHMHEWDPSESKMVGGSIYSEARKQIEHEAIGYYVIHLLSKPVLYTFWKKYSGLVGVVVWHDETVK